MRLFFSVASLARSEGERVLCLWAGERGVEEASARPKKTSTAFLIRQPWKLLWTCVRRAVLIGSFDQTARNVPGSLMRAVSSQK